MKNNQISSYIVLFIWLLAVSCQSDSETENLEATSTHRMADPGDGKYKNPILHADYSDPDVIRVDDDFYMTASSFNCVPGLPILHSKDLVNWQLVNYAIKRLIPDSVFKKPQHGNGVWAPAMRYHDGKFYIFYGDPDFGIYMLTADDPKGNWSVPHLVKAGKGWIDPCPFWDSDGKAYLVHAFAGSRAGIKSVLLLHEMSPDGKQLMDDGILVFDGHHGNRTVEGPKMYKRNDYYYIFAPAGGVTFGWQLVLRSRSVWGPYEEKKVLHQGDTDINGPHQGAWITTQTGQNWFIHFQDKEAFGRIVHLQPVNWENDWPLIGIDENNDGVGEPVLIFEKPDIGKPYPVVKSIHSDEFNNPRIGLHWQWHANPDTRFGYPSGRLGYFRLNALPKHSGQINLWEAPNLLLQKFPADSFTVTTKIDFYPHNSGDKTGLIIMGLDYSCLTLVKIHHDLYLQHVVCKNADKGNPEVVHDQVKLNDGQVYLKAQISADMSVHFSYSTDSIHYKSIGPAFNAKPGKWIGAKTGLFCLADSSTNDAGYVNVDWFRFN